MLFAGMGSSHYAPLAIRPALASAGVRAEIWEGGELLHYHLETCDRESVIVAVSQSGESAETRRVVEEAGGVCRVVSITNQAGSFLGRSGDPVLLMQAGEEDSIST